MPRTNIKIEYFQFIELKGSVTIDEFKDKFGLKRDYAASWLSKWTGKGYLSILPRVKTRIMAGEVGRPVHGGYRLGKKPWGDLVYGSALEFL